MELKEYFDKCNTFDWFYDYSDDHRVWERGRQGDMYLSRIASEQGGVYYEMYRDFRYNYVQGKIERPVFENYSQ